ncbi:hypothetical protein HYG81_01720 [Natrinema zhouii]|uniref:Glycosyltransferase family 39 protein n=1 Tax=Natrinema zhouii TaxID=1710539 RepID=A0A7D6GRY6_9EURY|nr:hypothetical protein [Natrinema zhouii]QLK26363.1 hypothetical protein HYG81_01720 [Natrinema zhouii]
MRRITHQLYGISSIALPVLAVIGISVPLLLGSANLAILGLYFAIPMIAAPVVVRALGSDRSLLERGDWHVPQVDWRVWSIAFHLLLSGLIALLVVTDVRPLSFYAGVALAYVLCFLLIMTTPSTRGRHVICLYHLMAIATLVIYSVTLNYDFFVGHGDLTTHVALVSSIVETGRTATLLPEYEAFQLWHIYAAVSSQLFGDWVAHHTTMYILSGGVFAAAIGLMYGVARRVYPNETVGLLSCLVLISFPLYLFYGMYSIPRSITSILFLALVLTLVDRPTAGMRILGVIFVGAIVVYHPVSIPFVLAILIVLSLIELTIETPIRVVDTYVLSVTALITAVYWLYNAEFIVGRIIDTIAVSFFGSAPSSGTPQGVISSPWIEVANYASYAFALFFVLVGFLFWQRRMATSGADETAQSRRGLWPSRSVPLATSLGILTVALVPLAFPGPTLLLDALAGVNVSRFGHYSFMFIALIAGYGLYELLDRGGVAVFLALLVLTSGFAVTAVSNDFTASDNPVVERPFYTFYLTDNERASFEAIDAGYDGEIASDRISCRYLSALHSSSCSVVSVGGEDGLFTGYDGVIIREGELEDRGRPLQFSEYVERESIPENELAERDRVYDSDEVAFYG